MKKLITVLIMVALSVATNAQDILYKKNGAMISCKIREITVDVIKYKRTDLRNSPVFEIKKEDVVKIRYKNGVVDIIDPAYIKIKGDSTFKNSDTIGYSMLYVVFNSGQSEQKFPLYINGNFICKLTNHSRLAFKMLYEGEIDVYRMFKAKIGPIKRLAVKHGNNYAISIKVVNEQKVDPNQRFFMNVIEDFKQIPGFLEYEYNGFSPFKELDFHIVEKQPE